MRSKHLKPRPESVCVITILRKFMLYPHKIDNTLYSDTFFPFKHCKIDYIQLMQRGLQVPEIYLDIIFKIDAPNMTITDNTNIMTGNK